MSDTDTIDPGVFTQAGAEEPPKMEPIAVSLEEDELESPIPEAPMDGEMTSVSGNMDVIMRIPVSVKVVLGSTSMVISDLANLSRGAIIPLDRKVGEPVDLVVNGRVVARGEIVVLEEDKTRFGISLTEVVGP